MNVTLRGWIEINQLEPGFRELKATIQAKRDDYARSALQLGDTEVDKAKVIALDWVIEHVLTVKDGEVGTDADTN